MIYTVKGEYCFPDLDTDKLVDMEEMFYFKKIRSIETIDSRPVISASDIEEIALAVRSELIGILTYIDKPEKLDLSKFPYVSQKLQYFFIKNPHLDNNPIITNFYDDKTNLIIFIASLYSIENYKDKLEQAFREFYFEYRFLAYISKYLYFQSINFDRKKRSIYQKEQVILDKDNEEGTSTLSDLLGKEDEYEEVVTPEQLENLITDDKLARLIAKKITERQKLILYLAYVKGLKDIEIAKKLGVSQQVASKTRNRALVNIRTELKLNNSGG